MLTQHIELRDLLPWCKRVDLVIESYYPTVWVAKSRHNPGTVFYRSTDRDEVKAIAEELDMRIQVIRKLLELD